MHNLSTHFIFLNFSVQIKGWRLICLTPNNGNSDDPKKVIDSSERSIFYEKMQVSINWYYSLENVLFVILGYEDVFCIWNDPFASWVWTVRAPENIFSHENSPSGVHLTIAANLISIYVLHYQRHMRKEFLTSFILRIF